MNVVIFIVAAILFLVGLWLLVVDRKRRTRTTQRTSAQPTDGAAVSTAAPAAEQPALSDPTIDAPEPPDAGITAGPEPSPAPEVPPIAPTPAEHIEAVQEPESERDAGGPAEVKQEAAPELEGDGEQQPDAAQLDAPKPDSPQPDGVNAVYGAGETEVDVDTEEALNNLPAAEEGVHQPKEPSGDDEAFDTEDASHADEDERADDDVPPAPNGDSSPAAKRRFSLPGFMNSARRERREWAKEHDYFFAKSDEFLSDEWSRGAAAAGAVARNVVSGTACGHEMHVVDLGEVCVMAMRRGSVSDVVIDARRGRVDDAPGTGEDLLPAGQLNDLRVVASEVDVAERFLDERVHAALEALPQSVDAVWCEGNWVLAQFQPHSQSDDWDAVCQPLSMLADAARALPPRRGALLDLKPEDRDPSRPVADAIELDEVSVPEEFSDPRPAVVTRPEEPVELPSRAQQVSRGVVSSRGVGTDAIAPIASGEERETSNFDGTKVLRDTGMSSSIFNDISAELGTSFTPEFAARLNNTAAEDAPEQEGSDGSPRPDGEPDDNPTTK
ncbi:hypothetical protein CCICO_10265 [Corynebacterium ciconiae DSM 44920]|uniref:hypothetical protein n=1 Tax=Corynebacterium ciconiae TaxID=227319 RepID=UPI00036DF1AC|nr:hypothetical protein [Corynebacterium ciconiae]WKD62052.1 hypothetical protein CCICO_10265 [Corynebacterium ciconiae DSM 44920]